MTVMDIIILLLIVGGASYGGVRGIRPALFLLIAFLGSLLGILLLTGPLEQILIRAASRATEISPEAYDGAPAVAVFILEGEPGFAYLAALIPAFITAFFLFALVLGGGMTRRFITEASRSPASRVLGAAAGIAAGAAISLLAAVQLVRLPWPPAGVLMRDSLIISVLNNIAEFLLPGLSGGL